MPIFEYRCLNCEEQFEVLVLKGSGTPTCPSCSSDTLEKTISLSAVSSEQSRGRALRKARKRANEVRFDKEYHEHQAEHHHEH